MFAFFMFERTKPYAPIFLNYLVSNSVCFFFFFLTLLQTKFTARWEKVCLYCLLVIVLLFLSK